MMKNTKANEANAQKLLDEFGRNENAIGLGWGEIKIWLETLEDNDWDYELARQWVLKMGPLFGLVKNPWSF